ncbi:MAG: hypothetical protein ACRERD_28070, partial [Candidatus Binatia bacterium]
MLADHAGKHLFNRRQRSSEFKGRVESMQGVTQSIQARAVPFSQENSNLATAIWYESITGGAEHLRSPRYHPQIVV